MKPSAFRIECRLAKVEAEVVPPPRPRRYAFHPDEVAEAEAQGLPYALVPRGLSKQEWLERYATPGERAWRTADHSAHNQSQASALEIMDAVIEDASDWGDGPSR